MTEFKINRKSKKIKNKKIWLIVMSFNIVLLTIAILILLRLYRILMMSNIFTDGKEEISFYIPTNADFSTVKDSLYSKDLIIHKNDFEWYAKKRNYCQYVKPGHYVLSDGMTTHELINMLNLGHQTPVQVVFNNIRTKEQFAARISEQIEADSSSIIEAALHDEELISRGFNDNNIACLFIPNTYEFYWNTDATEFIDRMKTEYDIFWNNERLKKAENLDLTPIEVIILASIVDKETLKIEEMPRIAGVYLNRLKRNWALQADPTLVFAVGDFSITRVLDVHKKVESPYNTYKYRGLPPGPICIPSISAIDAVLNAENHKYLYFCAKEDLSGYHNFAKTISEHNRNAEKYRKALDNRKIWK